MIEKLRFYFRHSVNDLRVNGKRTLFALLCIAAGVAAIVSLQTLGVMIDDTLTGSLRETNRGDIRINPFPDLDFGEELDRSAAAQRKRDQVVMQVEQGEYVFTSQGINTLREWFAEHYQGEVRLTYQQAITDPSIGLNVGIPARDADKSLVLPFIVEAAQYPLFGAVRSEEGEPLAALLQAPTDIVFSRNLADDLGAEIGDKIRLSRATEDFTLRGIVPTDTEGGFRNLLAGIWGYYFLDVRSIPLFEGLEPGIASAVFVGLGDPTQVDAINESFLDAYPYLNTTTTDDLKEQNSLISNVVNDLIKIMGLVSMLIGGIGIVNTMLVIVSRRTTEVAVLKTLGLEPEQVTLLFMVEAVLMGILGSVAGILLGWLMAFVLQGAAERFVAQSLAFRITLAPALNGFIVGILVTTIFGFLPTLAAGEVRPAYVLRPTETIIPKMGRLRSFATLMFVLVALSLLTRGLVGDLLDATGADIIAGINGAIIGGLMAVPIVLGGYLSMRTRRRGRSWALHVLLIWPLILFGLPLLGFGFGFFVNAILIISGAFILVGSLYLLLLLLIWAIGGGSLKEFPILGSLPLILRIPAFLFFPAWTAFLVIMLAVIKLSGTILLVFLGVLFFIHIPAIIVTLVLPAWALGQFLQRYGFLDLKIALRAMVATRGRGASTLLALVIGILTLSMITMLVDSIITQINELIEEQIGGNIVVFPAGGEATLDAAEDVLAQHPGVMSYAVTRSYQAQFISLRDVSQEKTLTLEGLRQRVLEDETQFEDEEELANQLELSLSGVDARELTSNLPEVKFYAGRQLDPLKDGEPDAEGIWPVVIAANAATLAADIEVGDLITFGLGEFGSDRITLRIVGMVDERGGTVSGIGSDNYAPIAAFGTRKPDQLFAIAEVEENQIRDIRRQLAEIPGVFVLETRLLNELITSVVDQFTSFPILVAALALFTGGIVIANSVALSTMERRREIGIMKAIGLQRERVLGMLLLENGLMGLVGGLIGVGIGVLLLIAMFVFVFEGELGRAVPYTSALLLMLLCIGIALVAAVLSVWGASGEKPMNVLRYE